MKDSRFCQSQKGKSLTVGCIRCSEDEREHSKHDEGAQVPRWKSRESACRRIYMRQYAPIPTKEKSGYERDHKGLQRARVALPTWPAYQPRRFPGEANIREPIVA